MFYSPDVLTRCDVLLGVSGEIDPLKLTPQVYGSTAEEVTLSSTVEFTDLPVSTTGT